MHLNTALISIFLFVSPVLSGPLREKDQSWIPDLVKKSINGASDGVYYAQDYAGAFWDVTNETFTFATATFNVPDQQNYSISVIIDHDGVDSSFAAGIISRVLDGNYIHLAWSNWPNEDLYVSTLAISPGDVIRASINVLSATYVVAMFENLTSKRPGDVHYVKSATQSLCGRTVMWAAGIFQNNDPIPFDTVTITNAKAYGPSKRIYEAEGARKMEISQNNRSMTSVSTNGSSVTINRVHE